jgi:peptidyl-dipeptidase A
LTGRLPRLPVEAGPEVFLRRYEEVARPLGLRHAHAYWDFCCTGQPEHQEVVQEVEETLSDLHADPRVYGAMRGWLDRGEADPQVLRQLRVLLPDYRRSQVSERLRKRVIQLSLEVEETFALHRALLDGERLGSNELDRILLCERDDGLRRAAWEATRSIGSVVADQVVELATLRNDQARQLGFGDFWSLALDDEEMPEPVLDGLLDELQAGSDQAWSDVKAELDGEFGRLRGKAPDQLEPWDYPDRFLQSIPRTDSATSTDGWFPPETIVRLTRDFYGGLGLPVGDIIAASDLMPRDGKYPHAFCIGVDIPHDVRVLCNLDATSRWMETTLHELGHALYNAHIDPDLPWLLREAAHTFVTEAVAMFFGRLVRDPSWLTEVAGVPASLAEAAGSKVRESQLVFARWALVVTRFERAMYADPGADLGALWWQQVGALQGLRRPDGWLGRDWASKVHVACYPVYYQNYLLGELLASQLGAMIDERTSGKLVGSAEVGELFVDLFRDGLSRPWPEAVRTHTGRPLGSSWWLEDFAG